MRRLRDGAASADSRDGRLGLIVAVGPDNIIGRGGGQPWDVPEDMAFYREMTAGRTLVVGRRTFDAIRQPPKGRRLVVVTSRPEPASETVRFAPTIEEAVELARQSDPMPMVVGGGAVYAGALPAVTDVWWTDLDLPGLSLRDGDVTMPEPAWPHLAEIWTRCLSPIARVRYLQRPAGPTPP